MLAGISSCRPHLQAGLRNEFSGGELVDCTKAAEGHEDEVRKALTLFTLLTSSPHLAPPQVLKALTLLMYLGTVKHLSQELSTTLQVVLRLSGSIEMETLQTEDSA